MNNKVKIWLIVAISLIIAGSLAFCGAMTLLGWDFSKLTTDKFENNIYLVSEDYDNIRLVTDTADIVFAVSEDGESSVACYELSKAKHIVSVVDGTLVVEISDTRKWYDYIGISFSAPTITVYLPREKYSSLSICGSTGSVEIPKDFAFEIVDVVVSTGDVTCLASAESICISANTGDLLVENVTTGSIQLSTSTGKVSLLGAECSGDVTVNVSTGKVFLTDVTCNDFSSKGSAGDISLKNVIVLEKLFIERDTGDVRFDCCDAEEIFVITDTGDVKGSLLTEKVFLVMTDTGSVDVPKTVDGGKCEITTDTGNIKITVN